MELYNKESLKKLSETSNEAYYLPKELFTKFKAIRLETKMAYVAILDTMMKKPVFNKDNQAIVKVDNPEIQKTLATLANKEVDLAKVQKYVDELVEADLIEVNKQDIYVYDLG